MRVDKKKRQFLQIAGAVALSPIIPTSQSMEIPELTGLTMGTSFRVRISQVGDKVDLPELRREIERVLDATEFYMSPYRAESELSGFNNSNSIDWQKISLDTMRVVETALVVQTRSGGAFNPAAGPLVEYWGFGAKPKVIPRTVNPPPRDLRRAVLEAGIELGPGSIRKANPLAALDLNGIAKGDALDGVATLLEQYGIFDYLVEIGGEIRTGGLGPEGAGWLVGLENPHGNILTTIRLDGKSVATSGDYLNYFVRGGKRYSHLVDPRSGVPVTHDCTMVSVVADSAMEADAWATALLVMGSEDGVQYAVENSMAALFLQRDRDLYRVILTPEFGKICLEGPECIS